MLQPGGVLVADTVPRHVLDAAVGPGGEPTVNSSRIASRGAVRDGIYRHHVEIRNERGDDFVEDHMQVALNHEAMVATIRAAGFSHIGCYHDYSEKPGTPESDRPSWVVRTDRIRSASSGLPAGDHI